ncbi:hypothetical protein [Acrocarpospora macrocephala]|nr:hypothetical protein [Acrocarpospora macrocephala]
MTIATGLHARPAAAVPAPKAVRDNVSAVFAKLQVADRAQAIIQAGLAR